MFHFVVPFIRRETSDLFGALGEGCHDLVGVRYSGLGDVFMGELDGVGETFTPSCFDMTQMSAVMFWRGG